MKRSNIEQEIRMKLSFLQSIQDLKQGSLGEQQQVETLSLGLEDRRLQLERAGRMVDRVTDEVRRLQLAVMEEEGRRDGLSRILETHQRSHEETLAFLRAKVMRCEQEAEDLRLQSVLGTPGQQGDVAEQQSSRPRPCLVSDSGCVEFSNLFSVAGQLVELCRGEQGSR